MIFHLEKISLDPYITLSTNARQIKDMNAIKDSFKIDGLSPGMWAKYSLSPLISLLQAWNPK